MNSHNSFSKNFYLLSLLTAVLGSGLGYGCKSLSANHSNVESVTNKYTPLWTDYKAIPVCFIQEKGFNDLKDAVKQRVTSEYAQVGIGFTGWQTCTADDRQNEVIRVEFREPADAGDGLYTTGCSNIGRYSGDVDCLTTLAGTTLWIGDDPGFNILGTALHEFGHALGLEHEQERKDRMDVTPRKEKCVYSKDDAAFQAGLHGYVFLTSYDEDSIMNYCSEQKGLTERDIAGLRMIYHIPTPTQVNPPLTLRTSCLGVDHHTVYPDGQVTTYSGGEYTCTKGDWINTTKSPTVAGPASCIGANGFTVYQNGVVTIYQGHSETCTDGHWIHGDLPTATPRKACLGSDKVTYADGIVTSYEGATWTCADGGWIKG